MQPTPTMACSASSVHVLPSRDEECAAVVK